jgi:F1F0 ATPase subunit 2
MTDWSVAAWGFMTGSALGGVFYGGLWWTVRRVSGKAIGRWLMGSFLLRTLAVLIGFFAVARGPWQGLAACVTGFVVARVVVTRCTRSRYAATESTQS